MNSSENVVLSPSYHKSCYHLRNRYMVDNSDALMAVWDGKPTGGTAYTVNYAHSQGKQVIIINPN
ncbi:MAG: putative molybdenum carrier protein [Clostridia bacterium]|nr:putative molybdenum carrier protein [Clostridia bacterium]